MNITVDDNPVTLESKAQNFEEVIAEISRKKIPEDRCLCKVIINGDEVPDDGLAILQNYPMDEIKSVAFVTAGERQVFQTFMGEAEMIVTAQCDAAMKIAQKLRFENAKAETVQGHYVNLVQSFRDFLSVMISIHQFMDKTDNENADVELPIQENLERSANLMESMILSQQNEDWVKLADLIEHELVGELNNWLTALPTIN